MNKISINVLNYYDCEVISLLIKKYGYTFFDATKKFLNSMTYKMLSDISYDMTAFGPSAIFDILECELNTGVVKNSSYIKGDING